MIPAEARGAWRDIEARLRPYVARRVASAAEVDDIVQEILVRVHRGLGSLRDDEGFGGWVYRIAARTIADAGRSQARDPIQRAAAVIELADAARMKALSCSGSSVSALPSSSRACLRPTAKRSR